MKHPQNIHSPFIAFFFLLLLLTLSNVTLAQQDAKIVNVSQWGSGHPGSSVLINDMMFHTSSNSPVIDVQDPNTDNQSGLVAKIVRPTRAHSIQSCNNYLVEIVNGNAVFSSIDSVFTVTEKYTIETNLFIGDTIFCQGESIIFMDRDFNVYHISYVNDEFTLTDVFQAEKEDDSRHASIIAFGLSDDKLLMTYLSDAKHNAGEKNFVFYEFQLQRGKLTQRSIKKADSVGTILGGIIYAHSGIFISYSIEGQLIVIDGNSETLEVSTPISIGTRSNYKIAYRDQQLYVVDFAKRMSIYDLSAFSNIRQIHSSIIIGDDFPSWRNHEAFFLGERFYVRHTMGFYEVVDDGVGYSLVPLYYQGGGAGSPVVFDNKAYFPRDGRIDVVNITDIANPALEAQLTADQHDAGTGLSIIDNTLVYYSIFSNLRTSDLSQGPNFEDFFSTEIPESGRIVNRQPAGSFLFGYSEHSTAFYRYNITSHFSLLEGSDLFDFDLPTQYSLGVDKFIELKNHAVALLDFRRLLLIFDQNGHPSNANPQLLDFGLPLSVNDIAGNDEFLFVLADGMLETYQFDQSNVPEKLWSINAERINNTSMFSTSIAVADEYLLLSENRYQQPDRVVLFQIQADGQLEYVSNTIFPDGEFLKYTLELIEADGYFVFPTQNNTYGFLQINKAPAFAKKTYSFEEDTSLNIPLTNVDPENDSLIIEVLESSANGVFEFDDNDQVLLFTPNQDFFGDTIAKIKVSDEHGNFSEADFSLKISPVNDAPLIETSSIELDEDTPIVEQLTATDVESDEITFKVVTMPEFATLTLSDSGELSFVPSANFSGSDSFDIQVSDSQSSSSIKTILVNVLPVNDLPVYTGETIKTANEDTELAFELSFNDVDSTSVTYSVLNLPEAWSYNQTQDSLTITPKKDDTGDFGFTLVIDDGEGSAESPISVTLNPINDPPVAASSSISTSVIAGQTAVTDLAISDIDNSSLAYKITQMPTNGSASVSTDGKLSYRAAVGSSGSQTITVEASDPSAETVSVTVSYSVTAPPVQSDNSSGGGGSFSLGYLVMLLFIIRFRLYTNSRQIRCLKQTGV